MAIIYNSKISDDKIEIIIKSFLQRKDAVEVAQSLGISRHTTERIYNLIRKSVACVSKEPNQLLRPCPSNFRGIYPIVGITGIEGGKKIFTRIVGSMSAKTYSKVLERPGVLSDLVSYEIKKTDGLPAWKDGVLTDSKFKTKFVRPFPSYQGQAINFLSFTNRFFRLYFGISWSKYILYLKEMEWRYNTNKTMSKSERLLILLDLIRRYSRL